MPVVDRLPTPERWRQVPPRDTTAGPPKHPVEHRAVIRPPPTPTRSLIRQQRLHPDPFLVGQIMTMQHQKDLPHPAPKIRGTRSDMEGGLSSGQGEAVSTTVVVDTASCPDARGGGERVDDRRGVSLICAGWLPQDGLFGW
jgi:hypothetical protein